MQGVSSSLQQVRRVLLPSLEMPFTYLLRMITRQAKKCYPVGILFVAACEKDMIAIDRDCACPRDIVGPTVNHAVLDANDREVGIGARPERVAIKRHRVAVKDEQVALFTIEPPKHRAVPIKAGDAG